ncbi:MAG: helix-turn-helix domain-containing protein [bacterium]|nr:helix-turn-helix domain-containing protein [bacterium]
MTLLRLGALLRERRGGKGIRQVADEIGISPATLTRIEGGRVPDLATFSKICTWLNVNPADILDVTFDAKESVNNEGTLTAAAVHLRAERALPAAAATDLAHLIVAAHQELARRARGHRTDVSSWL